MSQGQAELLAVSGREAQAVPVVDRDAKPGNARQQPGPYSASSRDVGGSHHLAEELGALAASLSHDSLETLVLVGRRLQRVEERT